LLGPPEIAALLVVALCGWFVWDTMRAREKANDAMRARMDVVDQESRIDSRGIGNASKTKARRSAAIGHRLADIDDLHPADGPVAGDVPLDP